MSCKWGTLKPQSVGPGHSRVTDLARVGAVVLMFSWGLQEAQADQQFVFEVKTHTERTAKSDKERKTEKSGEKDKPVIKDSTAKETLTLGADYFIKEDADSKSIVDLRTKRMFSLSPKQATYGVIDLHAPVWFRIMEFKNREMLGGVLGVIGQQDTMGNRFTNESLFGIDSPDAKDKLRADIKSAPSLTRFIYNGAEIASYMPSKTAVDAAYKRTYTAAISQNMKIHPSIRAALVEMNVPQSFKYSYKDSMESGSVDYQLLGAKTVQAALPAPPADFKFQPSAELKPVHGALDKLGENPKQPSKEKVKEEINSRLAKGNILDAFLTILEYSLSTGDQMTPEVSALRDKLQTDSQCKKFLDAYGEKKTEADFKAAIKTLESIDRTKLDKAFVIDIMLANNYDTIGDTSKARKLFISVLSEHPLFTGAYHDLGGNYLRTWQIAEAWDCFSMADRAMPNHPMMKPIHQMEREMEVRFPQFF
jgi:hypothetical protein